MQIEIERKFLVVNEAWRSLIERSSQIRQGYLSREVGVTVRVRTRDDVGFLTVKIGTSPLGRSEFNYAIPLADADALLDQACAPPVIHKVRHIVPASEGTSWEIDEFLHPLAIPTIAEIELTARDQQIPTPAWLGREVTDDPAFSNANIGRRSRS